MSSQEHVGRCSPKKHKTSRKMAQDQWRDAISWMRKEAAVSKDVMELKTALKDCQKQYEIVKDCGVCSERLQLVFDRVRGQAEEVKLL